MSAAPRSIRSTLTVSLAMALLLPGAVIGVLLYLILAAKMSSTFDRALADNALALAAAVEREQTPEGTGPLAMEMVDDGNPVVKERIGFFEVWGPDGNSVARSPALRSLGVDAQLKPWPIDVSATGEVSLAFRDLMLSDGQEMRGVSAKFWPVLEIEDAQGKMVSLERDTTGMATIVLAHDRTPLDRNLATVAVTFLTGAIVLTLAGVIAVRWALRHALRPLDEWGSQVTQLDAEAVDVADHPLWSPPTELLGVAEQLRNLLDRVGEVLRRERRFTDDVGHELRTPISEIRTVAEVALRREGLDDFNRLSFADVADSSAQLTNLINALLSLRRSEGDEAHREPTDLSLLTRHCVEAFPRIVAHIESDIHLETDASLVKAALRNLLDNACRYCDAGSCPNVRVQKLPDVIKVEVTNAASGVRASDVPLMVEPFWRDDEGRGADVAGERHFGLGLALVDAYANRLGGSFDLQLDEGVLTACLTLPVSAIEFAVHARRPQPELAAT